MPVNGWFHSYLTFALASENVFRAFHLITGSRVAIKVELQLGEACLLQYEAGVHRLLQGHPGIPRIRWDGMENNCHIIIMDQLGPNIGHLRQFCRGTLTLRTVLILAEQMVRTVVGATADSSFF